MTKIITRIFIKIVKFYQYIISPLLGNNCRYIPSCSEYFIDCLKTYGLFKGFVKGLMRLLSCHPIKFLGGGEGYKPLKDKK